MVMLCGMHCAKGAQLITPYALLRVAMKLLSGCREGVAIDGNGVAYASAGLFYEANFAKVI